MLHDSLVVFTLHHAQMMHGRMVHAKVKNEHAIWAQQIYSMHMACRTPWPKLYNWLMYHSFLLMLLHDTYAAKSSDYYTACRICLMSVLGKIVAHVEPACLLLPITASSTWLTPKNFLPKF